MEFAITASGFGELPENVSSMQEFHCGLPPVFSPSLGIHKSIDMMQSTIALVTAAIGLPLNIYLFIMIVIHKSLHQRYLFLCFQIITIEILYYAVIPATIMMSGIEGTWILGESLCNMTGVVNDIFPAFRFSMMLVLTIDRFVLVFWPRSYSERGGRLALILSACVWIFSLIRVLVPVYGVLDCYTYIPTFKTCTSYSGCSKQCEDFIAAYLSLIVFVGIVCPIALYAVILVKLSQVTKQHISCQREPEKVRQSRRRNVLITVFLLVVSIVGGTTPATTFYVISQFYRAANATIFITNMLIGRTFFNLIPVFDAIVFLRIQDIRKRCFLRKFMRKCFQ
jgi:hypothetical protein